jgi:hypothetical protein
MESLTRLLAGIPQRIILAFIPIWLLMKFRKHVGEKASPIKIET